MGRVKAVNHIYMPNRYGARTGGTSAEKEHTVNRLSWDDYFMEITELIASRSTCIRRQVGALLVRDKQILASGYNGAPSGLAHCDEVGCIRAEQGIATGERHELCRGLHAEQNAVIQAANHGVSLKGATLYSTTHPCVICTKMIINAGIERIVYTEGYADQLARDMIEQAGIILDHREERKP